MKHKHYEMIVAKAANMELAVFRKNYDDSWGEIECHDCTFMPDFEYFLCLPQRKEVCLHWLNGGKVQMEHKGEFYNVSNVSLRCVDGWNDRCAFMDDSFEIRTKPKKEKRWIGVNSKTMKATHDTYKSGVECEDALNGVGEICDGHPWQFIEIEVEV